MSLSLFNESYFAALGKRQWNRAYDIALLTGQINGLRIAQAILEGKSDKLIDRPSLLLTVKHSVFGEVPDLTLWQRLQLLVSGYAFLRWVKPEGYLGPVALYVVKCAKHGLFLDNPHGHREYFMCDHKHADKTGEAMLPMEGSS